MKQDHKWLRDELEIMRGPFPEHPVPPKIFPSQDRTRTDMNRITFNCYIAVIGIMIGVSLGLVLSRMIGY